MNLNYKKIFGTAIILAIVGFLFSWLTCGWLFNWVYLLEPLVAWKSLTMDGTFFAISFVAGFILMVILVGVYDYIREGIKVEGIKRGLCFGTMVWLVGILPGMWATYMFMNVNTAYPIYGALVGLVKYWILGAVIAWIYERK